MDHPDADVARLTIRLDAIAENYRRCRKAASGANVAGVVKADGYGLGAAPVTRALLAEACDTFFVARIEEGIALRPVATNARIFVLDGAREATVPALLNHALTPVLNSLAEIALWASTGRAAAIHIDTGMSRLGLPPGELAMLAADRTLLARLNIVLLMSHLVAADDPGAELNGVQLARFRAALAGLPPAPASLSSSGGLLLGRDFAFDLVRPGIALYGGNPTLHAPNPFATTARLAGRILQLRRVDKGECVGYGATFRVGGPMTLATVALGYADGLMRALGNRGSGAIGGQKVPIVGRVSMDLVTLDVSSVAEAQVGAEVEFLGDTILLEDVAQAAGTASYEILTSLGHRARRHYEVRT
jgi:alanine racemase